MHGGKDFLTENPVSNPVGAADGVVLLAVPRLAGVVADQFDNSVVNPDGAFAWISVHHIVQALIFLALMLAISKLGGVQFDFG